MVVPTHNRIGLLRELIDGLARCDPAPDEVVVVDDGSSEPVENALGTNGVPFRLRVLRNDTALGPGAARNRGVHASRGRFVLFTDDDCLVDPGWVGALVSRLESENGAQLGGVGGAVRAYGDDVFSRYYEFHKILEPRPHDAGHPERIPYLVTANCGVRRDVFMRAGGFDTRIPTAGGEDAAFSLRIVKRGYHLEREDGAVVWHRFRPGLIDFARTFYRYGLGGRYVVDRYLPC